MFGCLGFWGLGVGGLGGLSSFWGEQLEVFRASMGGAFSMGLAAGRTLMRVNAKKLH